jgi:hypothetical protein
MVVALIACSWIELRRGATEEYAVYSAYLSEGLLNDAHDWSAGGPVRVVIEDTTIVRGDLIFGLLYAVDNRARFENEQKSTRASYLVRNLLHTRISSKFVLPNFADVALVSHSKIQSLSYGSSEFQKEFPHNMGYITLSGVGFNLSHTQGVFFIDHFCGLCGGGRYVLMEKVNSSWLVRDEHWTWIS